jgi:hypothetical protein
MEALTRISKPGYTLPGVEIPHIYKDPPRARYTRKYEPVEIGDVTHYLRSDTDRLSDYINLYPRGVDPMKSVEYQNTSGGQQASLPYKIMRDGDFRPPMYAIEDRLPLSRMKRPDYIARTNPCQNGGLTSDDMSTNPFQLQGLEKDVVLKAIAETNRNVQGKSAYTTVQPDDTGKNASRFLNKFPVTEMQSNASQSILLPFFDPMTGRIMKDYKWKTVYSGKTNEQGVTRIEYPWKELESKRKIGAVSSHLSKHDNYTHELEPVERYIPLNQRQKTRAHTNPYPVMYSATTFEPAEMPIPKVKGKIVIGNDFTTKYQIPSYASDCPEYKLNNRKIQLYQQQMNDPWVAMASQSTGILPSS